MMMFSWSDLVVRWDLRVEIVLSKLSAWDFRVESVSGVGQEVEVEVLLDFVLGKLLA